MHRPTGPTLIENSIILPPNANNYSTSDRAYISTPIIVMYGRFADQLLY